MTDVHAALETAVQRRAERDRLASRSKALGLELGGATGALAEASAGMEDEAVDVHHLESFSPVRIWAALRGRLDTDLDRERDELEKARYLVAAAQAKHDELSRALAANESELASYADADAAYDAALSAKDELLRTAGGPEAAQLLELSEQRGTLGARETELREAVSAATTALQCLGAAEQQFSTARTASNWDTFGGGGLLTDLVKYDRLDKAKAALRDAVQAVATLSRELADVGLAAVDTAQISGFSSGFDVWFDNFFSDMSVRSRIIDAHDRVRLLLGRVDEVRITVQDDLASVGKQLEALDARRVALLTE